MKCMKSTSNSIKNGSPCFIGNYKYEYQGELNQNYVLFVLKIWIRYSPFLSSHCDIQSERAYEWSTGNAADP